MYDKQNIKDLPVYYTTGSFSKMLDCHHMQVFRAWEQGYIKAVAFANKDLLFEISELGGVRRYLEKSKIRWNSLSDELKEKRKNALEIARKNRVSST